MMPHVPACVFCDIVARRVPACQVYADADCIAFLDHAPLRPGHVLLVPRTHWPTLGDLPAAQVGPLFLVAQRLALAVERAMQADGSFVALNIKVSQSVPHVHVHVVPRNKGDGLFGRTFQWIRRPYPNQEVMAETQQAIAAAVQALPTPASA
jgi:histidine triad (HIT) family protein